MISRRFSSHAGPCSTDTFSSPADATPTPTSRSSASSTWPDITSDLCGRIAKRYEGLTNLVAGPTTGGVILAFETARQLGTRCIIAEKRGNGPGREFRRGFEVGPDDSVLVVDDVLTTGGSVRDVIGALRQTGATVAGVGMLIDRSGGSTDFGVPFFSCLTVNVESWDPGGCRLCTEGVPLTIT